MTDSSYMNYNLFSPPVETEGGFIPKEPPILDNVYENTIASTTNLPKLHESKYWSVPRCTNRFVVSCLLENLEIPHGDTAPAQSPCETCRCFYGNVVCQKIKCPGPQFGCKGSLVQDLASCCPHYVCGKSDFSTSSRNALITVFVDNEVPDRTNLAPQSFYFDKVIPTTEMTSTKISMSSLEDLEVSTDSTSHYSTTPTVFITTNFKSEGKRSDVGHRNSVDVNPNLAVLKLAGCNIYGRMYRVGRIISELSNPCLECKCTEIGVQCKTLKCWVVSRKLQLISFAIYCLWKVHCESKLVIKAPREFWLNLVTVDFPTVPSDQLKIGGTTGALVTRYHFYMYIFAVYFE